MMKIIKRLAAFVMCVALVAGVPSEAFAADWDGESESKTVEVTVGENEEAEYNESLGASQASTYVDILIYTGVEIIGQTEDSIIDKGDDLQLGIAVRGFAPFTYKWEISLDQGTTWKTLDDAQNAPTYDIKNAQYMPDDRYHVKPYLYRVTVTDETNRSDSTIIKVLVVNKDEGAYSYYIKTDRKTEISVGARMHFYTKLRVNTITDENDSAFRELSLHLQPGCLPLITADIELYNDVNEYSPYIGNIDVKFPVGSKYNGQTLKVYQLVDGEVVEYEGVVKDGILHIVVEELGKFMVEVPAENVCTITATASEGGSLSPSGTINVAKGADKTIIILPDTGYEIGEVLVDGNPVDVTGNSYTFTDVSANHTFDVTFEKLSSSDEVHTVTVNCGKNGSASPSGTVEVKDGQSLVIGITPSSGYEIDKVLVNGVEFTTVGGYLTISSVTKDTVVDISFKKTKDKPVEPPVVKRTITASAGFGGTISPSGETTVNYGGDMYVYIIPDEGYVIDTVTVDGKPVEMTGNAYRFVNIVDDHKINATFRLNDGTGGIGSDGCVEITAESGPHGTISPSGKQFVVVGGSQTFHFIPDKGYAVSKIIVNGKVVAISGLSYTIDDVQADTTIRVEFVRIGNIKTGDITTPESYVACWVLLGVAGGVAILMIVLIILRKKKEDEEVESKEEKNVHQN